ncbi:MAG: hypothetical protein ABL888_05985 [Pirellulaceae bacterium]
MQSVAEKRQSEKVYQNASATRGLKPADASQRPSSGVSNVNASPHTPDQELTHFGTWVGKPIWVPPNGCSPEFAKHLLGRFGALSSKEACWEAITKEHREKFTQVRELELPQASIRLPQGRLYVSVTERAKFDQIEDKIPKCVQMRLEEFLNGPGKKRGVKVYYLKPLCVEIGNDLVFTTREQIQEAIAKIQGEVFSEYRRRYPLNLARQLSIGFVNAALAIPRALIQNHVGKKKREIEAFHAHLEFERRKRALEAAAHWKKYRMTDCSFDEVIALTNTPDRKDVIEYYVDEHELSKVDREMFLIASAISMPWFVALSVMAYQMAVITMTTTAAVTVCDPAFVAEMPGSNGRLLKIGHFDEVGGVMHVEI